MDVAELGSRVNPVMEELLLETLDPFFHDLILYCVRTGGKRLRPALLLFLCKAFGGDVDRALIPAAGIELIHQYSLIVDDIIDHGVIRRGKETVIEKFGNSITECVHFYYASAVVRAALKSGVMSITDSFQRILSLVSQGEMFDILFEQSGHEKFAVKQRFTKISVDDYYNMIYLKSAVIFEEACFLGAMLANASKTQLGLCKRFGREFGLILQLTDDLLDVFGDESKFGKKIGKDFIEHKMGNLVILHALKSDDSGMLKDILSKDCVSDEDVSKATVFVEGTGAHEYVASEIKNHVQEALSIISEFKISDSDKDSLKGFISFLAGREV